MPVHSSATSTRVLFPLLRITHVYVIIQLVLPCTVLISSLVVNHLPST